jgi:hypothetical protein
MALACFLLQEVVAGGGRERASDAHLPTLRLHLQNDHNDSLGCLAGLIVCALCSAQDVSNDCKCMGAMTDPTVKLFA